MLHSILEAPRSGALSDAAPEILTYSRSRGLFAGVSLEGSTLRPDNEANRKLYKKDLHARDIVLHHAIRAPASARQLLALLNGRSPRNRSQRG
jgi:lipid-binding SYLF domain-containing protein